MKASYAGPLFQLYNGSTTLDIGQTAEHTVDLSTWSAFCSGVASNCKYSIIYGQINGNNLVPAIENGNCDSGGNYVCAAPLTFEAATGLPVFSKGSSNPYTYYVGTIGSLDTITTGINSGTNPLSIVYNGNASTQYNSCCGQYGMTHSASASTTFGTDFMAMLSYSNTGPFPNTNCAASTQFCAGAEEENAGDMGDYGTSSGNVVLAVTWDGNSTVTGSVNNSSLFSNSPPGPEREYSMPLDPGQYLHMGGGGDLSNEEVAFMREALITNSALSSGQISSIYGNMTAFYNGVSFP